MKIGFVDLSRLFDEHHKTAAYDVQLETEHKQFEDTRNDKIQKIQEAQGKLALLNEDKKAGLEAEIEKMKADLLEFDREQKTTLTKERNEKIREILLEIEQSVSSYAEKEGFDVILNDRVLIYGNPAKDLTDEILANLNTNKK
jgi:outer membrane protein